jgi:Bacterial SH3 domain
MKLAKVVVGLGIALGLCFAAPMEAQTVLKVKVQIANIRSAPNTASAVLGRMKLGELAEASGKSGEWYEIAWPGPDGRPGKGYLLESLVDVVVGPAPVAPAKPAPATPVIAAPMGPAPSPPAAPNQGLEGRASGFTGKFGIRAAGRDGWYASLGYDLALGRLLSVGIELMPTFSVLESQDKTYKGTTVLANGFLNVKAGTSLGFLSPEWSFVRVYAGAGAGGQGMAYKATSDGQTVSMTQFIPAVHVLGGVELKMKSGSLIFEYQAVSALDPVMDPDPWLGFFIFGIRL